MYVDNEVMKDANGLPSSVMKVSERPQPYKLRIEELN